MNREILAHQQRIDALFDKATSITDLEIKGNWARYLCVLVSGFVEESIRTLLKVHLRAHAGPTIQRFTEREIGYITNCKQAKILEVLSLFNATWSSEFERKVAAVERAPQEIKNALDSVVTNRHDIAHGRNTGISVATISGYYQIIKKVILILDDVIS